MTEAIETLLEENQMGGLYLRSCILISHLKKYLFQLLLRKLITANIQIRKISPNEYI